MSNITPPANQTASFKEANQRKLLFTHGVEIENFITNKQGDILEDGKELVAVWDQMFNGALSYLQSLTSSTTDVPAYIRQKIKRVTRTDVERHGKIIRYVQIQYQFNGQVLAVNVFGPDPNISQITWLLELVTPPCEYLEELDWWINTLYLAAANSITKGYNIQPLGFNPHQTEYRAGVTCGEHHHIDGFKNTREKFAAYNMIRAYIPHLISFSCTSPFIAGKPSGKTILKKGPDGRTLILAPDCIRSHRLKENSGQLGPNIPEYLPYLVASATRQQFSRYVRKEIPDDRYVDVSPFTSYGTIEMRFFDTQFDQKIRLVIIILIQALAKKAANLINAGKTIPEVKGNTIFEHRKRAINFGLFAKFQGDPSIESAGGEFVKYYNHNPETGGPPGKIYESLMSLLIWLKPELVELNVTEEDLTPLLIMLWGTARIAPPISATTFMLYLYEQNHSNVTNVISNLALLNGKPRKSFTEILGRPSNSLEDLLAIKAAQPKQTIDTTKSSLARKLQQDSRSRRKKSMDREKTRLKAKQDLKNKMQREKIKKEKELEKKKLERLAKLEQLKKAPPKPIISNASSSVLSRKLPPSVTPATIKRSQTTLPKKQPVTLQKKLVIKEKQTKKESNIPAKLERKPTTLPPKQLARSKVKAKPKTKSVKTKKISEKPLQRKMITQGALGKNQKSGSLPLSRPPQAYARTATTTNKYQSKPINLPQPSIKKDTKAFTTIKRTATEKKATVKTKTTPLPITQTESFRDSKIIKNVSITSHLFKSDSGALLPAVKIRWKKSLLQSKTSLPISVEVEVSAINAPNKFRKTAFQEKMTLEKAALRDFCYLPVPIELANIRGEFQAKFIVKNLENRNILAIEHQNFSINTIAKEKGNIIRKLAIPPNQVGDTLININIETEKKSTRGKITLWGVSQRGIVRLYEKKSKFNQTKFSLDIPVLIPASMCSSVWFVFAEFNTKGMSATAYTKTSPPLSQIINLNLNGNPPLKLKVNTNFVSELTPKFDFKAKCEIQEIEILQIEDNVIKHLKKYRLKTRIRKGEKFLLESFTWKAPNIRKGFFSKTKSKTVKFGCRIVDNFGVINDSLIGMVETPTITVYKSS